MAEKHEVRIGTSGWKYPLNGYGPWTGVFYPFKQGQTIPGTKAKFDELGVLRRALRHGRDQLNVLPPACGEDRAVMGGAHPGRFRVQP